MRKFKEKIYHKIKKHNLKSLSSKETINQLYNDSMSLNANAKVNSWIKRKWKKELEKTSTEAINAQTNESNYPYIIIKN